MLEYIHDRQEVQALEELGITVVNGYRPQYLHTYVGR